MKKISDLLREEREKRKLTLEEVEKTTKIKKSFLAAIESGEFDLLPSESYALGFVKTYASLLGYPEDKTIALFRRQYEHGKKENTITFKNRQSTVRKSFFNARNVLLLFTLLIIFVYIFFQYGSLIFGPKLEVSIPKNGAIVSGNIVEVKGKTDPYATLTVNGDEVYVAPFDGSFKKSIYSFTGEQRIKLVARNRFGKSSERDLSVVVK